MTQMPPPQQPQQPVGMPAQSGPVKRPGGLTALAVLNFVFGGVGAVVLILAVLGMGAATAAGAQNTALVWLNLIIGLVVAAMLLVAGVGYLKMSRSGYIFGNVYAILSIVNTIVGMIAVGFGVGSIIGLAYPIITLALLNGPFKKYFVN